MSDSFIISFILFYSYQSCIIGASQSSRYAQYNPKFSICFVKTDDHFKDYNYLFCCEFIKFDSLHSLLKLLCFCLSICRHLLTCCVWYWGRVTQEVMWTEDWREWQSESERSHYCFYGKLYFNLPHLHAPVSRAGIKSLRRRQRELTRERIRCLSPLLSVQQSNAILKDVWELPLK